MRVQILVGIAIIALVLGLVTTVQVMMRGFHK